MLGGREVSVSTKTESVQAIISRLLLECMYNRFFCRYYMLYCIVPVKFLLQLITIGESPLL